MVKSSQKAATPPRRGAAGRGGAGAASSKAGHDVACIATEAPTADSNSGLLARINEAVTYICSHKEFRNIDAAMPLTTKEGASGAPYSQQAFKQAMTFGHQAIYTCHINLFWLDPQFIAMTGVPIREEAVNQAIDNLFVSSQCIAFPSVLEVAAQDPESFDATAHKGALKRVSPPEEFFAFRVRMEKDLKKASDQLDKDTPRRYRKVVLDVSAKFLVLKTRNDMWWHEYTLRERVGAQYRMVYQTSYQRICGVVRSIQDMVATHGRDHATQSRVVALCMEKAPQLAAANANGVGEQQTHEAFIRECYMIYEHMESVEDSVKQLDMTMGHANPLDSVYKLAAIRKACVGKPASVLTWVMYALTDNILMGVEAVQSISINDLRPGKSRCLATAYVLKKMMLDMLLEEAGNIFPFQVVVSLREITASHQVFRQKVEEKPGVRCKDLSFMTGWPNSARFFLDFVSKAIFTHVHPFANGLQQVAKGNSSPQSVLNSGAFLELWDRIKGQVAVEAQHAPPLELEMHFELSATELDFRFRSVSDGERTLTRQGKAAAAAAESAQPTVAGEAGKKGEQTADGGAALVDGSSPTARRQRAWAQR